MSKEGKQSCCDARWGGGWRFACWWFPSRKRSWLFSGKGLRRRRATPSVSPPTAGGGATREWRAAVRQSSLDCAGALALSADGSRVAVVGLHDVDIYRTMED